MLFSLAGKVSFNHLNNEQDVKGRKREEPTSEDTDNFTFIKYIVLVYSRSCFSPCVKQSWGNFKINFYLII